MFLCNVATSVVAMDESSQEVTEQQGTVDVCLTIIGVTEVESPITVDFSTALESGPIGINTCLTLLVAHT